MATQNQIAAVRYLIAKAEHGTDLMKKILWFLVDQSVGLTKEVRITLFDGQDGFTGEEIDEAAVSSGAMCSCAGTTHISEILQAASEAELKFSCHFGHFDKNRERLDTRGMFDHNTTDLTVPLIRYTFWLGHEVLAPKSAHEVRVTRSQLECYDLSKPGLYPSLEKADAA